MYYGSPTTRLKILFKYLASPVLDACGVFDRRIDELHATRETWTIVMYHRVIANADEDPFSLGMCVRERHFDAQLAYFRRYYNVITLAEGSSMLQRGEALPPRALSISFDDGYLDNATRAAPMLEHHGLPWTLFVTTGGLEQRETLWWDRVIRAFALTRESHVLPADLGLPADGHALPLRGHHRIRSLHNVLGRLWTMPIEEVFLAVARIESRLLGDRPPTPELEAPRMQIADIRALRRSGVEIGAHTVRHPNLKLLDPAAIKKELTLSRQQLETMLDVPITGLAYPGGRMNDTVVCIAGEVGFDYAVNTVPAINQGDVCRLQLQRIGMPDTGVSDFKRSLHAYARQGLELSAGSQISVVPKHPQNELS